MVWNTPGSGGPDRDQHGVGQGGSQRKGNRGWRLILQPKSSGEGVIWRWIIIVAALILCASSIHVVPEQQQGVVLRFGRFNALLPPGVALTWPWPIESVTKINTAAFKTYRAELPLLTSDENIVYVTVNAQYQINDPRQYLFACRDPERIFEQTVHSVVREQVGHSSWSRIFKERSLLAATAKEQLQNALQSYQTGLVVSDLTLINPRPPDVLKSAFEGVDLANQARDRSISEAQAYAANVVPQARGRAESIRVCALTEKSTAIARAQGEAERFSLLAASVADAPALARQRLWFETMEQVLKENHTIINSDGHANVSIAVQANSPRVSLSPQPSPQPDPARTPSSDRLVESAPPPRSSPEPVRNPERQPRTRGRQENPL